MNKLLVSTLIVSTILTSAMPTTLWAATTKKVAVASVKQTLPIPVKLLNAKVTDEHLYYIFAGELLVSDTGASKQVSIVVGDQVISAKYKTTREDGKEIWSFNLGFNRQQLFVDDVVTFVIRYKANGKTIWDANPKYRLTDESNVIFGDTAIKLEKSAYDWTFNSVDGTIVTKNINKAQSVTVTYTTNNWLARKTITANLIETNKETGLQKWGYSLPTESEDYNVRFFVTLNTPQKTYIDNNAGLGYNIYR